MLFCVRPAEGQIQPLLRGGPAKCSGNGLRSRIRLVIPCAPVYTTHMDSGMI